MVISTTGEIFRPSIRRDSAGHSLSSGVYLYKIEAGSETANGRLVLIR